MTNEKTETPPPEWGFMDIWNHACVTPPSATKDVKIGAREFTAVDAYWQMEKATELFGPIGIGWGWDEPDFTILKPNEEQKSTWMWHTVIRFWYVWPVRTGDRVYIPIHVQSKVLDKNGNSDDDVFKKMTTDGLTKALSYLGWSADVFKGLYDDHRYVQEQMKREREEQDRKKTEGGNGGQRRQERPQGRQKPEPENPPERPRDEEKPPQDEQRPTSGENPPPPEQPERHPLAGDRSDIEEFLALDPADNDMTVRQMLIGLNTMSHYMGDGELGVMHYLKEHMKWGREKDVKKPYLVNLYRKHKRRAKAFTSIREDEDKMEAYGIALDGDEHGTAFWMDVDWMEGLADGGQ